MIFIVYKSGSSGVAIILMAIKIMQAGLENKGFVAERVLLAQL